MDLMVVPSIIDAVEVVTNSGTVTLSPVANAKLLSIVAKIYFTLARACRESRQHLKTRKEKSSNMSEALTDKDSLCALEKAKKLCSNISPWLEDGRSSFSSVSFLFEDSLELIGFKSNAKKIPGILFKIEQFELDLIRLLDANKSLKGFHNGCLLYFFQF